MKLKRLLALILGMIMLLSLASCGEESKVVETKDEAGWFTTWTSAQLTAGPRRNSYGPRS